MNQDNKHNPLSPRGGMGRGFKELSALFMLTVGAALAIIALFMPPPGEIHDSVLYLIAQCLIYAGSIFGISMYMNDRHDNGKDSM